MPPTRQYTQTETLLSRQLRSYEEKWFQKPRRLLNPEAAQSTWESSCERFVRRLKEYAIANGYNQLNTKLLVEALNENPLGSRNRVDASFCYRQIAKQFQIPLPEYFTEEGTAANAHLKKNKEPSYIPTDEEIFEVWKEIPRFHTNYRVPLKLMYALQACFGLRTHEVGMVDVSRITEKGVITVHPDSKTGERLVYSLPPEWIDKFGLRSIDQSYMPGYKNRRESGKLVSTAFHRFREHNPTVMPFVPYSLRHAYAMRAISLDVKPQIACKLMGHSLQIHTKTYYQNMSEQEFDANLAHLYQT